MINFYSNKKKKRFQINKFKENHHKILFKVNNKIKILIK